MTLPPATCHASDRFISASAAGADWRAAVKAVLEQLQLARQPADNFTLGFLYLTDDLAEDAASILSLLRGVTGVDHWTGATGLGIFGGTQIYLQGPAITVMLGAFAPGSFCPFPAIDLDPGPAQRALEPWLEYNDPLLVLVHGDPLSHGDPATALAQIERLTGGFVAGGMASGRGNVLQFSDAVMRGGISGVAFAAEIAVASTLTQGCAPIGPPHTITRCEENVIMELDGQRAFDVFAADLKSMARTGENGGDFRGEVHVAFPVEGSDQRDYLVRSALGIDPEKGWIAVAHNVASGERMMFVHRDRNTVRADLSRALVGLRGRIIDDYGTFAPQGALYISCVARSMNDFSGDSTHTDNTQDGGEIELVRAVLGEHLPLAGFYANGEIANRRLYGYSAILILFL